MSEKTWHGDTGILSTAGTRKKRKNMIQATAITPVGHYLNIIDSDYAVTGFAMNQVRQLRGNP